MKKLKIKTYIMYIMMIVLCIGLTACSKTVSYTFNCETGDSVEISMDLTNSDDNFIVNGNNFVLNDKEGSEILYGGIDYKDNTIKYNIMSDYNIIDNGKFNHKDLTDVSFIKFSNGSSTFIQYCGLLPNSNSCIIVRCFTEKEKADQLMNNLSFKLVNN